MRRFLPLLIAAALAACKTTGGVVTPIVGPPPQPPQQIFVIPPDANILVVVSEAVAAPEDDISSYARISVDGRAAGQTQIAPKAAEKKWGTVLPVGNHLFRFENWVLPLPGEWTPLEASWQPPERFIRIEPGLRTIVTLKFYDGGRRHTLQLAREPITKP